MFFPLYPLNLQQRYQTATINKQRINKRSVFAAFAFLFGLFRTWLQMKVLTFFLYVIDYWIVLWCLLLFWVDFSQRFWHLLECLAHVNSVLCTHFWKFHPFCLAKLFDVFFWHLSILLLAIDLIAQNAYLNIRRSIFFNLHIATVTYPSQKLSISSKLYFLVMS